MDAALDFSLFLVDPRGISEVKPLVERALGCDLQPEKADRRPSKLENRFEAFVLGVHVFFSLEEPWRDGVLYRLVGGTESRLVVPGMAQVSIDGHVVRLLRRVGFKQVVPRLELVKMERKGPYTTPVVVRSAEEAHLYIAVHPCFACGASRFEPRARIDEVGGKLVSIYEGECETCGAYRYFELQLDDPLPPAQTDEAVVIGTGKSMALTADEFAAVATGLAKSVPVDASKLDEAARGRAVYQLRLAIGALDEAVKLASDTDAAAARSSRAELIKRLDSFRRVS